MLTRWQGESEALLRVVEGIALSLNEAGVPRMPARVLAYMLVDEADRYSAAALAEGLRVSPAAISGAVRHLASTRMVVKEREPGKRAALYRVCDGDVWARVVAAWVPVFERWESALDSATVELGASGRDDHRLAEATTFIAFLRSALEGIRERWSGCRRGVLNVPRRFGSGCFGSLSCGPRCFVGRWPRPAG